MDDGEESSQSCSEKFTRLQVRYHHGRHIQEELQTLALALQFAPGSSKHLRRATGLQRCVYRRIPPEVNVIQLRQLSESASEPLTPGGHADLSPSHALPILHRLAAHLHAGSFGVGIAILHIGRQFDRRGGGGTIIDRTNTSLRLLVLEMRKRTWLMAGHTTENLTERSPVRRSRSGRLPVHLHVERGAQEAQISGRSAAN